MSPTRLTASCGASANFAGSGGAIVGSYTDEAMYQNLVSEMKKANIAVLKPIINS